MSVQENLDVSATLFLGLFPLRRLMRFSQAQPRAAPPFSSMNLTPANSKAVIKRREGRPLAQFFDVMFDQQFLSRNAPAD
jgi:hypothetical protein